MVVPKAAVERYLSRELDDHTWAKDLLPEELDAALADLQPPPDLWSGLHHHQRVSFLLGVAYPGFAFWLDMGSGKTLVALELLRYWWRVRGLRRALVFVTSDKAFPTWERQVEEFDTGLPCVTLEGSSEEKWARLREVDRGVVLVTYPGAVAMASRRVSASGRGKKERMELDPARVAELGEWAGALVLDESTRCGNHRSLTFQLVNQLRQQTPIRYALAGRPFGRDPSLLHAQYLLVDGGETLGTTLGLFRAAFFRERKIPWDPSGRAREYKFRREMEPELSRMLQHRSITYTSDECVDLPEVVPVVEEVSFTAEAETYYRRVVERLRAARGNYREMENVFTRMRQVSSGFVGMYDDETGERAEIEFAENPKLERLLELVGDMPVDAKAVVFYDFTWSGRRLTRELDRAGFRPIWLWSGTPDYRAELERFCSDPRCRVAVINSRVGAYSLDGLQRVANYLVFYESPVSVIDREQAERRVRRQGQPHRVFQYDLVVRGSLDRRILEYHQEGESLFDALLRDPEPALEDGDARSAGDGGATGRDATRGRTRAA